MVTPELPEIASFGNGFVEIGAATERTRLALGERVGAWTLMAVMPGGSDGPMAVFEDFATIDGRLVVVAQDRAVREFTKTAESTSPDPSSLYRGHSLADVLTSDHDLLGAELLALPGDPTYADVAAAIAPITTMATHTFVGTPTSPDKVGVAFGGRTANFDPAIFVPEVAAIRSAHKGLDGLVGGWLPVLRFVYPEGESAWTELVMFAPLHLDNDNPRIQPVWYRVCRVEAGELTWVKYVDSYPPFPPRLETSDADGFFGDLLALRAGYEAALTTAMTLEVPDERIANQARHSLVRSMITRIDGFPKYGVMDRNYGGSEHDGFQDTFTTDVTAMLGWGLFDLAGQCIDNYFTHFVRDDGSIVYRGPGTGQYGRMLTVVAEYARYTGDSALLLKHRARIDAVTRLLLSLREEARQLPVDDAAYGMLAGWCEADSCLEEHPERYMKPYLSNSSEAVRAFADLGGVWATIGRADGDAEVAEWGCRLQKESSELNTDLQTSISRSIVTTTEPTFLPTIAGASQPWEVAVMSDRFDPQFRAYRANMELLFSGVLTPEQVGTIVAYREARRDIVLGVPAAYGYNHNPFGEPASGEMAGFLSYGHAYGLLQHDRVREFILELYSLSAHQYTRGSWTAPETRRIDPEAAPAPYAVPAQLAVPMLVRWMLAFEEPTAETLWIAKATPREWLADGQVIAASGVPTRWGRVSFRIESDLGHEVVRVEVGFDGADRPADTKVRLRVPGERTITSVELNGQPWNGFDARDETVDVPADAAGVVSLLVHYA